MKHSMFMFINEVLYGLENVDSTKMSLTDKKICSNFCFEHVLKIFERKLISGGGTTIRHLRVMPGAMRSFHPVSDSIFFHFMRL